jgi:hypothetical protein
MVLVVRLHSVSFLLPPFAPVTRQVTAHDFPEGANTLISFGRMPAVQITSIWSGLPAWAFIGNFDLFLRTSPSQ